MRLGRLLSPMRVQLAGFLIILAMSALGFRLSQPGFSWDDSLFKALQLFGLNYDVGPGFKPHVLVQLGRFLAPLFIAFAVIELISHRLFTWIRNLVQARMRGRTILMGYGQVNRALLRHLTENTAYKDPITVVDRTFTEADFRFARAKGILMYEADMTDPLAIARLHPETARSVYVACGSDVLNLEVGSTVAKCIDQRKRPKPGHVQTKYRYRYGCGRDLREIVHVHAASPKLMDDLARSQDMSFPLGSGLRFFSFKTATAAALVSRARFPMRANDLGQDRAHLVICCAGEVGEAILVQALTTAVSIKGLPDITIIDRDKLAAQKRLQALYPRVFDETLPPSIKPKIKFVETDITTLSFETDGGLARLERLKTPPSAWIFASRSDELNIAAALRLEAAMSMGLRRAVPVYARAWEGRLATGQHDLGLTQLFGRIGDFDVCDLILSNKVQHLAEEIHAEYLGEKGREKLGPTNAAPFVASWSALPEDVRQTNVRAAMHLPQRIADLGFDWRGQCQGLLPRLSPEDPPLDRLKALSLPTALRASARTEHNRWMIDRAINGWREGSRDNRRKLHPNMVSFSTLNAADKQLDLTSLRAALRMSQDPNHVHRPMARPRRTAEFAVNKCDEVGPDVTTVVLHFGKDERLLPASQWRAVEDLFEDLCWHKRLCRVRFAVHGGQDIALAHLQSEADRIAGKALEEDKEKPFLRWLGGLTKRLPDGVAVDLDFHDT